MAEETYWQKKNREIEYAQACLDVGVSYGTPIDAHEVKEARMYQIDDDCE